VAERHPTGRLEQQITGSGRATADHHFGRIERVDRVGHPDSQALAPGLDQPCRDRVAAASGLQHVRAEYGLALPVKLPKCRFRMQLSALFSEPVERAA
jgi:hypothetical protein